MADPTSTRKSKLSAAKQALLAQRLKGRTAPVPTIPRRSPDAVVPLSFSQQRLWFLYQFEPDSPLYNIPFGLHLQGKLDTTALEQVLQTLVQRHEILRTTIADTSSTESNPHNGSVGAEFGGHSQQIIHSQGLTTLTQIDLSALDEQPWDEVERLAQKEVHQPFDLRQGPLLRVTLLTLADQEFVLLVTLHHIISDVWSTGVLVREIATLYHAFTQGLPNPLPSLPLQYADFTLWQRQRLQGEYLQKQIHYWQQQFATIPPVLQLPSDRPRSAVQRFRGSHQNFSLSTELTQALKSLSKAADATLFMTLLAALKTLLYRYTGQTDITVGSPIANRNHAALEGLLGLFMNTLALRSQLDGDSSFRQLLNQVREVALGAYSHQDLPFEKLVETLQLPRDLSHTPLFQVMLVLQNAPNTGLSLPGLTLQPLELARNTAKFDLTLTVVESEGCLQGTLEYSSDLFDSATIERLLGHFQVLLTGIAANPDTCLDRLPLLTPGESAQLRDWRQIQEPQPDGQASALVCLHQRFEAQVEQYPEAIAVTFEHHHLTYAELNQRANQLARHLQALGVGPEVLVGICVERSLDMIVGLLGILKAGGAYVPLDPTYPPSRLQFMVEDAHISLLLTQAALLEELPHLDAPIVCLDEIWPTLTQLPSENLDTEVTADNLAYIIYTSGSTGIPKGVMIPHQNVVRLFDTTASLYNFNHQDCWTFFHSYAFDFSVWELWGALLYGGRLVVVPYWVSRSSQEFYDLLVEQQVTVLNQTPSAFSQLIQVDADYPADTLKLRYVIFGGEALAVESLRPWFERHGDQQPQLVNMYGITETTVHVTYRPLSKLDLDQPSSPIGRALPDLQSMILDRSLQPVPIGIPGELYIGGVGLARGYLNRPKLTAERFIANPFGSGRLYKTGDLARYLPDGTFEYLGRIDHQVKIRGFRIELGEIEAKLRHLVQVQDAVVMVQTDQSGQNRLVAYLTPQHSIEVEAEAETVSETNSDGINSDLAPVMPSTPPQPSPSQGEGVPKVSPLTKGGLRGVSANIKLDVEPPCSVQDLRQELQAQLPDYMVPATFVWLKQMPLNANGKIDRAKLQSLDVPNPDRSGLAAPFTAARSPLEQQLATIWTQVLGVSTIGIDDNFFELGGDSILSLQIIAQANQAGLQLTPKQLFQHQTIRTLATVVETATTADQGTVVGPIPLTPIQRWFFDQPSTDYRQWYQTLELELRQPLTLENLQVIIHHLLNHHDGLRLSFQQQDATWTQHNDPALDHLPPGLVSQVTLSGVDRERVIATVINNFQNNLDLATGPLFQAILLEPTTQEDLQHLLLIAHQLVIDPTSWQILTGDIQTLLQQQLQGQTLRLSAKTHSLQQWCQRLQHQEYQDQPLEQDQPSIQPSLDSAGGETAAIASLTVSLDTENTQTLLQHVPLAYRTHTCEVLLTALVQTYAHCTQESTLAIDLAREGRNHLVEDMDVSRTIGWFETLCPIAFDLTDIDQPASAIKTIKEQHRQAARQADSSTASELLPTIYFSHSEHLSEHLNGDKEMETEAPQLRVIQATKLRQSQTYSLYIDSNIVAGQLRLCWTYQVSVYSPSTIETLAQFFLETLRSLMAHCLSPAAGGYTPSDFPLAQLDQATLDCLVARHPQIEDCYPLTPIQQGFLFHALYAPDDGMYVTQICCRLQGELDVAALQKTWQLISDRHPILRTAFVWQDLPEPLQVVQQQVVVPWQVHDWRSQTPAAQKTNLAALLEQDQRTGFQPHIAPLMRPTLVQVTDDTYDIIWSCHHILLDGWSMPMVIQEIFTLYENLTQGQQPTLSERRPYREYIAWLMAQDLSTAETFWTSLLEGFQTPTSLGYQKPQGALPNHEIQGFTLDSATATAIQTLAQQHRITPNTLVQATWAILLSQISGQTDIVFGATTAGRPPSLAGVDKMVGLFINTLPVRVKLIADMGIMTWMQALQTQRSEARQYEYSPLNQIQRWSELPAGIPLFESLIVFENYRVDAVGASTQTKLTMLSEATSRNNNYPLTLRVLPREEFVLQIMSDRTCFTADTTERWLHYLKALLQWLVAHPDASVGDWQAHLNSLDRQRQQQQAQTLSRTHLQKLRMTRRKTVRSQPSQEES
ncbi:MAG: amino acid adenylation domain-containing protein [Cyanothece sp. SIO2G6]|nr:amino acid adenylation domain-containing protein [Cyanothece sp. SIO2G6]